MNISDIPNNSNHRQSSRIPRWVFIAVLLFVLLNTAFVNINIISNYSHHVHHYSNEIESTLKHQGNHGDVSNSKNVNNNSNKQQDGEVSLKNLVSITKYMNNHHSTSTPTTNNNTKNNKEEIQPVATVAYAVSLVKCGDKQTSTAGLIDASVVLNHSIHLNSFRNPASGSKYDYKMYAIVHEGAKACAGVLEQFGFEILIKPPPVQPYEIQGDYLRQNIHKEWCCGHDEFVKLYSYTIENHPIIVHLDVDFLMVQPMDDVFDALLYPYDSPQGLAARSKIELEFPQNERPLPQVIDAFYTKDYHQVPPGRTAAFQAGFIVHRPNPQVFNQILDVIKEGNYVPGFSRENGWGGKGYGGMVGAMAMQGLVAYFYEHVRTGMHVELNGCRYNHMGADILYRNIPAFYPRNYKEHIGKCRNFRGDLCEDCQKTPLSAIHNIHFTNCRKPWNCVSMALDNDNPKDGKGIDERTTSVSHCLPLIQKWHETRKDFEDKLYEITKDEKILNGKSGEYKKDIFMGHCNGEGQSQYNQISINGETFRKIYKIY